MEVGVELIGILQAFDIAARAGITVPIPGAADPVASLDGDRRHARGTQAHQQIHAGEPGADNHHIHLFNRLAFRRHFPSPAGLAPVPQI